MNAAAPATSLHRNVAKDPIPTIWDLKCMSWHHVKLFALQVRWHLRHLAAWIWVEKTSPASQEPMLNARRVLKEHKLEFQCFKCWKKRYVCKASRKWHTSKSQPPFTCDCGVSSSGSRTLSVGGAPQAREVCVVPQEQCGVVTLCDLPGPQSRSTTVKKGTGSKGKRINTNLPLPWQRHRLPQGGANVFWIQDPPFPKEGHRWVSMLSCHRAVSPASKIFGIRANLWK